MADAITIKALQDASLDAKSLEEVVNGNESKQVTTRKGETYPSVKKALKELFENGGIAGRFKTLAELQASSLADGSYALVADDTDDKNGIYIKETEAWVKSKYDPVFSAISKAFVAYEKDRDLYISNSDSGELLDVFEDATGEVYRYTDKDGGLNLTGLNNTVQDSIDDLGKSIDSLRMTDEHEAVLKVNDANDNVVAYFDNDANLHLSNDIYISRSKVTDLFDRASNNNMKQNVVLNSQEPMLLQTDIHLADDDVDKNHKRMPFGIKTDYGLLVFYHRQVSKEYDGDTTGSELWKAVIDIDSDYKATVRSKVLFVAPDEPYGIIKHPMLCRLNDGRIMLVFEKRLGNVPYQQYVCYSNDGGLSFTSPATLNVKRESYAKNMALGTTGSILLLQSGRLLIPCYAMSGEAFAFLSDDGAESWYCSAPVKADKLLQEPATTVDLNGDILMITRVAGSTDKYVLKSTDDGLTWRLMGDDYEILSGYPSQATLTTDDEIGFILASYTSDERSRSDFKIAISADNGKSYAHVYTMINSGYIGYSHIIKLETGVYAVLVENAKAGYGGNNQENVRLFITNLKEVL